MFGHVINLNFNKQGESHKTSVGGFFSLIIKCFLLLYVGLNFKKLIWHEDDSNSVEYSLMDLDNDKETLFS